MARSYEMTWVDDRRLWRKVYRGKTYYVSCKQLREQGYQVVAETKEGSYRAANEWWARKQTEIDQERFGVQRTLSPVEETGFAFMEGLNFQGLTPEERVKLAELLDKDEEVSHAFRHHLREFVDEHFYLGKPLPETVAKALPAARIQELETARKLFRGEPATEPARTVEAHAETWLKRQQAQVEAGQMTAARAANNRTCLEHFKTFLGPNSDVAGIDAERLDGFYLFCVGKIRRNGTEGWSTAYAKDVFSVARAFVRWAWERGACELPKNIGTKFKFGSPARAVKTWTADEYKKVVDEAPGKLKLALLLMVNCGMTQQDVSDLLDTEVDWAAGRIIRKRSKTADRENVPTVNYRLWPLTFELLKKYRSGGERVLLTEAGKPYVRTDLNEKGMLVKADGFASNYAHLKRRLKLTRPLKQLRKLGASLLSSHKDYGRFASYFLGHSPRTVADRHYIVPPQELFDEAVLWLGRQVGQVSG